MANYVVTPDHYAGWNPTGRYFSYAGAAIGLVGLLCWLALHGHLGTIHPTAAADITILALLSWIGIGGCLLMLIAGFGSISISLKTRGTVTLTENGVTRVVGKRSSSLSWPEIAGFVAMPGGGVTLVPTTDKPTIFIPRFLDDYRACIAELKDHGIGPVPASRLKATRKKQTWLQVITTFFFVFLYLSAIRPGYSHTIRIIVLCTSMTLLLCTFYRERTTRQQPASVWGPIFILAASIVFAIVRMAHSW